jgi:hypothetical protein
MVRVNYENDWSVDITEEQQRIGMAEARRLHGAHYPVWKALVDAGVPVRDAQGKPFATLAATAITNMAIREKEAV